MGIENENELEKYIADVSDISDADTDQTNDDGVDKEKSDDQQQQRADGAPAQRTEQDKGPEVPGQARQQTPSQDGKGQQQQEGQQGAKKPTLRPLRGGGFADEKGNIVDEHGNIIAESGFAARIHQKAQRQDRLIQEQDAELQQLRRQVGEATVLNNAARQYNLDNNDVARALDLAGRVKRGDVLSVAKEMVAMAAASGHNVTDILGTEAGDNIDMRALSHMINQALDPVKQQTEQSQREQEVVNRARQAYEAFVRDNEYADVHADAIAKLMKEQGIRPQQAYNNIRQFAIANRLDFTQPLGPQIEARMKQNRDAGNGNGQQPAQQQRKPMPNGAETRHAGVTNAGEQMANADDDWSSIVRSAMAAQDMH